jgi:hypothetical protein
MKMKRIVFWTLFNLLFASMISCEKEADHQKSGLDHGDSRFDTEKDRLVHMIANDSSFIKLSQKSFYIMESLVSRTLEKSPMADKCLDAIYGELFALFEQEKDLQEMEDYANRLIIKYSLDKFPEKQCREIMIEAAQLLGATSTACFATKNNCQSDFEEAFHKAHGEYKATLVGCLISAVFNPAGGAICSTAAAGVAIYKLAIAIDDFYKCKAEG